MRTLSFTFLILTCLVLLNCNSTKMSYAQDLNSEINDSKLMFVIEREIPDVGQLTSDQLKAISQTSCDVIEQIKEDNISWLHSYVTSDKVYCVYLAKDKSYIKEHAKKGGFPANSIESVVTVIDPGTANQ